jgi:hypothetical protein
MTAENLKKGETDEREPVGMHPCGYPKAATTLEKTF